MRASVPTLLLACLILLLARPAASQNWQRMGPPGGMVISLASAADGTVYLGTADGHVFASTDSGEHWELRGRAGARLDGVVQRIVTDTSRPKRVLAAVWFRSAPGGGVFASSDGGWHWESAGLEKEAVRALEQSPSDPLVWVAGTRGGVFRSTDGAQSWQRITPSDDPELQNVDSLAIDPREPQTIYVGTYHLPWKTTDGGKTWNSIAAGMIDDSDIMSLRIDTGNPRRIFSSACSGIYRSDDSGAHWIKLQGIPYSSRRTQQIVQDPAEPGVLYAATTEGLWATGDYGESWRRITPRETVANAVAILPGENGQRILAGFEAQGVLRSDDLGNSFAPSNLGFSHRVIAALAADPHDPKHLLAHVEGFAGRLLETRDGGESWAELRSQPAGPVREIFATSEGWWVSLAAGGIARLGAGTSSWRKVPFAEPARRSGKAARTSERARRSRSPVVAPSVRTLAEASGSIVAATDSGVWQFDSSRNEFRRVSSRVLPASVTYIAAGMSGSLLALAADLLWTKESGGKDWSLIPKPVDVHGLLWVQERTAGGERTWLAGTQNGVFRFESGQAWRKLSRGLPAIGSEAAAFSGSLCLISMSNGGIYESSDGLESWRRIDSSREQGSASRIVPAGDEGFFVGSQTEGLLRVREEGKRGGE